MKKLAFGVAAAIVLILGVALVKARTKKPADLENRSSASARPESELRDLALATRLASLEKQLLDLRDNSGKNVTSTTPNLKPGGDGEAKPAASTAAEPQPRKSRHSPAKFGLWLDQKMDQDGLDPDSSMRASQDAEQTIKAFPNLSLEGLECAKDYCRADFLRKDPAEGLNVVFGHPPFLGQGFTVPDRQNPGKEKIYFTRPGGSFGDLRKQWQALESRP